MNLTGNTIVRRTLPWVLAAAAALPMQAAITPPEDHVVPLAELHQQANAAATERSRNIADVQRVLSYPAAAQALSRYNVNAGQMKIAVSTLSDEELARLAERARASEHDVQGGLIVGILALIGLIVVIIIVVTLVA